MGVEDKTRNAAARTRRPALRSLIGGATNSVRLVRDRHQRLAGPSSALLNTIRLPFHTLDISLSLENRATRHKTRHSVLMSNSRAPELNADTSYVVEEISMQAFASVIAARAGI